MTPADKQTRETLDLVAQLVASLSDRVDRLAEAQKTTLAAPDRVAEATSRATAQAVRDTFMPDMRKLVDVMEDLTGRKEILQERVRAIKRHDKMKREQAGQGPWRSRSVALAVIAGIPLLLTVVLGLALPRAMAETSPTCRAMGGQWSDPDQTRPAVCLFWVKERQPEAGGS